MAGGSPWQGAGRDDFLTTFLIAEAFLDLGSWESPLGRLRNQRLLVILKFQMPQERYLGCWVQFRYLLLGGICPQHFRLFLRADV